MAHQVLPDESVAEEYVDRYCSGEGLITTHPTEGEQVNIVEFDLGKPVEERLDAEKETIEETDPYGSDDSDDDDDPEPDNPLQGTIGQ